MNDADESIFWYFRFDRRDINAALAALWSLAARDPLPIQLPYERSPGNPGL
jgi:hypothetical protein